MIDKPGKPRHSKGGKDQMLQSSAKKKPSNYWEWQKYVKREAQRLKKNQEQKPSSSDETVSRTNQTKLDFEPVTKPQPQVKPVEIEKQDFNELESIEELDDDIENLIPDSGVEIDEGLEDWIEPIEETVEPIAKVVEKPKAKPNSKEKSVEVKSQTVPNAEKGENLRLFGEEMEKVRKRKNPRKTREKIIENLLDPVITLDDAALILNVCKTSVRRYTNAGKLECIRTPGNQRRFRLSTVLEFLEEREGGKSGLPKKKKE